MKKFLFTLATLIAVGFAANAGAPELAFSTNELDLTPGGDPVEVKIIMTKDAGEVVAGVQLQWVLRDETGARVQNDEVFIVKQNLGTPRVPNWQWFRSGVIMDDMGVPVASSNPFQAKYRLLLANTSTNIILMGDEVEYYTGQGIEPVLATFQIQAADTWDGEYVTVNFECNPKSMEQEGEDEYPLKWSIPGGSQVVADGSMGTIEVNNTEYQPSTTPLTGTVTIGAAEGYEVPITVDVNGTYDLVVTVAKDGGEAVEVPVNDGKIVLGVEPDYGTYVINATATGNGDYSGTVTATPATVEIEQPKKADPTINFEVGADGTVNIVIEGATRYEVKVDGVLYDGLSVAPIYDATQEVVVEAWNEAEGYIAGHATNNTTVAEKAYAPAVNPTITFVPGETGVTINVEDYTSYEVIVDGVNMGQINFVEKTWEEQNIVVNAVNEPEHQLKGEATESYTLAAKGDEDMPGTLTIGAVDQATGLVHIAYVGDVDVTIEVTYGVREVVTINGKEGDIQLTEKGVTYHIVAVAKAAHYVDKTAEADRIWNESEYTTPDPVTSYDEATFTITAQPGEGSPEGTVVAIYVGGQKVAEGVGTQTYEIPQTDADQYVSYYATATAPADAADIVYPGMSQSATAFVPAAQPQAKDFQGTVTVSVDENGNVTAVYNPAEGEDVEPTVVCDPAKLDAYGENIPVVVTVSAPGYNDKNFNETVDFIEPTQPKTAQPGYNVATVVGQQGTFVTLSKAEGEDECEIQYRYMIDNGEWSPWMTYSDMLTFNAAGYYTMEAKAKAANKEWSDPVSFNFTVNPKPTSIDEIMNAENVANVRFFNVAGQEMNEINGMTIVVVTYTNGQTVATKVMK